MSLTTKNLPDCILQEIRCLIAVVCRNKAMTGKKAGGDKLVGQELLMEKLFHGSEAHESCVHKLFMKGKGLFEMAFVPHEVENNREGNENRTDGKMYELRSQLHCDMSGRCILEENGFTGEAICLGQGEKKLDGRNINEKALLVIATLKFAYKHYYDCLIECAGDNPSGLKMEDMLLYVRQHCHRQFKGKKNMKLCRSAKNAKEVDMEDMPNKCFFAGCFAFVLFGPNPISGESLECLTEDDSSVAKKGRAASRKEELEDKKKERNAAAGGYCPEDYRRGVNLRDKVAAAQIAQSEQSEKNRNVRELLMATIDECRAAVQELELMTNLANNTNSSFANGRVMAPMETLSELDERKKRCRAECDSSLEENRSGKRQVNASCDQVGTFTSEDSTSKKVTSVEDNNSTASALTTSTASPPNVENNSNSNK